ncbi:MAG: phenylalanine--tRNA ligase subunit beta [Pyrinomonadaceae bacterium]
MNISYNWLKDLIDFDLSPDELATKLTNVGLAVEGVHAHGDDLIFDVDLTSNRPDCLSHLGVARELGVIQNLQFKIKNYEDQKTKTENHNLVTIEDDDLCHRFTARIIKNVKIEPSPKWLADRLEAIGERAINNVADITNYVMHALGQPMHAFDLDKLAENRIIVRRARAGERIMTLKDIECELDDTVLAICDAEKPVAVGGVVGGLDSSITADTVNVLLEVAYFKRENIRATSRKLNLATEASYRFERGVDIENLIRASNRATELICELAGGEAGEFIDVYPTKFTPIEIESKDISAAVFRLTGVGAPFDECERVLSLLGIVRSEQSEISNLKSKIFIAPTWRHDLAIEEDLVEEVARHVGYENISTELPPAFGAGEYQPTESREKVLRQTLVDMGFDEALSYSFIDPQFDEIFETVPGVIDEKAGKKYVTLQDSVIEGAVRMRPSILPGLLDAVRLNFNHQRRDVKLFELGKVFASVSGENPLPNEQKVFALILTGGDILEDRLLSGRELDFYDAKGSIEAAVTSLGLNAKFSAADVKHLRSGQSASVEIDGFTVGYLGRLNDEIAASYKFKQPVFVAEINLETALGFPAHAGIYRPLAKFPSVVRDVSFVVKRSFAFGELETAFNEARFDLCRSVDFVDVYEGKGMAEDERSLTIRLEYRSDDRTLTEDEVEAVHRQILGEIEQKLGIKPRV